MANGAAACPRVAGFLLHLHPDKAESTYQRLQLRSACSSDMLYVLCALLCVLVGLLPADGQDLNSAANPSAWPNLSSSGSPFAIGPAALTLLLLLLSVQLLSPAFYMQHRRAALVLVVLSTLAGDVCWLRACPRTAPAPTLHELNCSINSSGDNSSGSGTCSARDAPVASWATLADVLLVRSGVSVACMHALMLALDFPMRIALHSSELALIMHHTTLPLARLLSGPRYLPPLRRLHTVLHTGLVRSLAALAALPLHLPLPPLPVMAASPPSLLAPPGCLPLVTVSTVQITLGLLLPLWVAFLWERGARSSFALALRRRAAHDLAAAAAGPHRAPPSQPCCCGDPVCTVGLSLTGYSVQGVPGALLRALFLCAHGVCFAVAACAVWFAANLVVQSAAPGVCML